MQDHNLDQLLADAATEEVEDLKAPSRLTSRIYSALMRRQAATGALLGLPQTRAAGRGLCVFEALTSASPTGERVKELNLCRVCHARLMAEHMEAAPIFWKNCPYVDFQKR